MKKRIMVPIFVVGLLLTTSIVSVNAAVNPNQRIRDANAHIRDGDANAPASGGTTIYVDDNADPDWYDDPTHVKTIQEGIGIASGGDTVFVYSGKYYGEIDINVDELTIQGENKLNTDINSLEDHDNAVIINSCKVSISGFTISNGWNGILVHGDNNVIDDNIIKYNDQGIRIRGAVNNQITNNIIEYNGCGIDIIYEGAGNNIISDNIISYNEKGIHFWIGSSNGNQIIRNNITDNIYYGISIGDDSGHDNYFYYNNFINNGKGVSIGGNAKDGGTNFWNDAEGKGNYWDDYKGRDPDGDGIGNTPYEIPGGSNQDYYPLMKPYPKVISHTQGTGSFSSSNSQSFSSSSSSSSLTQTPASTPATLRLPPLLRLLQLLVKAVFSQ